MTLGRNCITSAAAALFAFSVLSDPAGAFRQDPPPKPKPVVATPAPVVARGVLVVSADAPCRISIDGEPALALAAGQILKLPVSPGRHIVRCTSAVQRDVAWSGTVDVKVGEQAALEIPFQALVDARVAPAVPSGSREMRILALPRGDATTREDLEAVAVRAGVLVVFRQTDSLACVSPLVTRGPTDTSSGVSVLLARVGLLVPQTLVNSTQLGKTGLAEMAAETKRLQDAIALRERQGASLEAIKLMRDEASSQLQKFSDRLVERFWQAAGPVLDRVCAAGLLDAVLILSDDSSAIYADPALDVTAAVAAAMDAAGRTGSAALPALNLPDAGRILILDLQRAVNETQLGKRGTVTMGEATGRRAPQSELDALNVALLKGFERVALAAAARIAKRLGASLVLPLNDPRLAWYHPSADATAELIREIDTVGLEPGPRPPRRVQ